MRACITPPVNILCRKAPRHTRISPASSLHFPLCLHPSRFQPLTSLTFPLLCPEKREDKIGLSASPCPFRQGSAGSSDDQRDFVLERSFLLGHEAILHTRQPGKLDPSRRGERPGPAGLSLVTDRTFPMGSVYINMSCTPVAFILLSLPSYGRVLRRNGQTTRQTDSTRPNDAPC